MVVYLEEGRAESLELFLGQCGDCEPGEGAGEEEGGLSLDGRVLVVQGRQHVFHDGLQADLYNTRTSSHSELTYIL